MSGPTQASGGPRILTREECETLAHRVLGLVTASAAQVGIWSSARTSTEFARGDTHVASEQGMALIALAVEVGGKRSSVHTTRLDEAGLMALVAEAEALAREHRSPDSRPWLLGPQTYPKGPPIYFGTVVEAMTPEVQAELFRQATDATEAAGLIGAGNLDLEASARAVLNTRGLSAYQRHTYGEFSLTARTRDGTGSGWAWSAYEDWARVKVGEVIARAVDLGQRSAKPAAVEPGRYTVILEPAAVAALVEPILREWPARWADAGITVFAKDPLGTNKLGLQIVDRRLRMISSPWDPERPGSMISSSWTPIPGPVTWWEQGVLRNLVYDPMYAEEKGRDVVIDPRGARLEAAGSSATLEEMIASTKRGIWVNRLSHVVVMNRRTLLLTGTTRDGTFLIENGKITKAIKNFRFTESPFFVFNKLEAGGTPVRASGQVVAPRLKVRDFDFTSLTDAI